MAEMADSLKLNEQTRKILIEKIKEEFPGRGYYPTREKVPTSVKHKELFKLATVLGGNLNETIHYEVNSYKDGKDSVHYVDLHLWEDGFIDNYDSLREMLYKETCGKDDRIKWVKNFRKENDTCRYIKVVNSVDEIIEGFKCLSSIFDKLIEKYKGNVMINECVNLLESNSNLVLTGAPGTGKTYLAKQMAKKMIGVETDGDLKNSGQYDFVQFHPSYDYTDFVEGLRPTKPDANGNIGFERQDGVFKSFCKAALMNFRANGNNKEKADKFVFIIDEINRGDISKIFGELFFSIDPGYRGEAGRVQTQYQNMIDRDGGDEFKDGFYVPENVYIIGTMNDIDRSVESMDFAMRRRFAWKEIKAEDQVSMLSQLGDKQGDAVIRMTKLNNEISNTENLTSAYYIGPSYFLKLLLYKGDLDGGWKSLWNNHIEGVLREYLRGAEDVDGKIDKLRDAFYKKD